MPASVAALLTELVDYAGLFPPAALPMRDVVEHYASYCVSPHAWMLGRLVLPVARLAECRHEQGERHGLPWHVSALVSSSADIHALASWNSGHAAELLVDACEIKATTASAIDEMSHWLDRGIDAFVEIPVADDPSPLLDAIARHGLNAKIRTGGTTPDAFPLALDVARFLLGCRERGIRFKATAGLHHPLRGSYRLTYDDSAPRGTMFGFVNLFAASALAFAGAPPDRIVATLEERNAAALKLDDVGLTVGDTSVASSTLADMRQTFALSFGSCSFTEPVMELQQLGVL